MGIDTGVTCETYVAGMKRKRENDNNRKKLLSFKKRRCEIRNKRVHGTLVNETKEGKTYEKDIDLCLPKSSSKNDDSLNTELPSDTLGTYENAVPPHTTRPQRCPIVYKDATVLYNIVLFDTETNTTGKKAELCQLAAMNKSGGASFSEYILPNRNIDKYASRVNNLFIRTVDGKRVLFKESNPVVTLTCEEALSRFVHYLEALISECQMLTTNHVCTVLLGHNAMRFDVPVLLHNSNSSVISKLQSLGICFGDTLSLFKNLAEHPALKDHAGNVCSLNQSAIYHALFSQNFDAHDALEDVKALHRILFSSPLLLTVKEIITHSQPIPFEEAYQDSLYLEKRHQLLQTLKFKLFAQANGAGIISQNMAERIAGSGLSYADLHDIYKDFGKNGLLPQWTSPVPAVDGSNKQHVTKNTGIMLAIGHNFEQTEREE